MGTTVSANNQRYLTKEFIESQVRQIMASFLTFEQVVNDIRIDARSVIYKQEAASHSSDTNKVLPKTRTESSDWTYVNIEAINIKSAILNSEGFAVRIDRDAIRFAEGVDEIQRAFNRIGYWMAQHVNDTIGTRLKADATGPTTKLGSPTVWSAAGATPIKDLLNISEDMRQEGFPYRVTDVYTHDDNWYELQDHVLFLDNRKIDFTSEVGADNNNNLININKVPGVNVWGLLSGIDEGDILALDRNNKAATMYHSIDPEFSVTRPDESISDIQIHRFKDNKTHDEIIQIWKDFAVVVKEPEGAIFGDNKI